MRARHACRAYAVEASACTHLVRKLRHVCEQLEQRLAHGGGASLRKGLANGAGRVRLRIPMDAQAQLRVPAEQVRDDGELRGGPAAVGAAAVLDGVGGEAEEDLREAGRALA